MNVIIAVLPEDNRRRIQVLQLYNDKGKLTEVVLPANMAHDGAALGHFDVIINVVGQLGIRIKAT